ncbi:hypothetical protein [Bacillus pumilus]|uniref:DUF2197 domain-containing protein n=1 Tax=Bacillus pumilus TaxID=1408 RepID=A0AAD0HMV6_BACPU|nr:hypothetical protein [Bacillus pumilus]AVM24235.1 hypothetical protein C5695_10440 [Bacillus pumilus]TYS42854.1 hypothetical protein FZC68_10640 [Bacillus pumilus]
MNYICEICSEGVEKYPLCLRLTEENAKSSEDRIEFNCCGKCAEELSEKIREKCEGMNIKKTLKVLGIEHIKPYKK